MDGPYAIADKIFKAANLYVMSMCYQRPRCDSYKVSYSVSLSLNLLALVIELLWSA